MGNENENVKPKKCDVRLSDAEQKMLEDLADANEVTKSDIMRDALKFFYKWCTEK